jgi:hypothetical protein
MLEVALSFWAIRAVHPPQTKIAEIAPDTSIVRRWPHKGRASLGRLGPVNTHLD